MHLSKLIKVLQSFDRPQITRLRKYIHSPYFAVYPPSIALFKFLDPLYPHFPAKKISVEIIAAHSKNLSTLPKQETAGTRLLRTLEHFIAQEEWQKSEAEQARWRLKGFKELSLAAEFEKGYEKEMEQLEKNTEQNFDTFFERHALTELSFNGFRAKLNRTSGNDIMPVVQTLDEFHALKKLRYLCEALNRQQVLGAAYTAEHIPALLKILEPYNNSKYPYVYLFINVYRMLAAETHEDSDLYYRLIKQFAVRTGPSTTIREAMTYAINQCLYWNNKGYEEAGNEYLWWIEWKRKHKLLLEKGKLMPITFRNIISIAVINRLKPQEIEKMINTYAPYLPEEYSDTYLAFANGLYHYALKKYKAAIRCFLAAQAKEVVVFNCIIRRWQWVCLYECDPNDTDGLLNQLLSFEKYLQRNKKELQHVAPVFEIFIDYSTKLLKATEGEMMNSYWNELQSEEHFPAKPWLLQQFTAKNKKPVRHAHR